MIRLSKYGFPGNVVRQPESRVTIFEPALGFDGGQAPQELPPGYTPASQNVVSERGEIKPRSGFSRYEGTYDVGGPVLFGFEAIDIQGRRHAIATSADSVAYMRSGDTQFLTLAWFATSDQTPLGDYLNGWDGAQVYEPARDKNIAVLTNNRQLPKFLEVDQSTLTYSDFTWCASSFSRARSVCESNYRIVFFNVSTATLTFPTRVQWTARGNPLDFSVAGGGGFEDLLDMRGVGQRIYADGNDLILFTDEQIWRGRPRDDLFAYDFYAINRQLGCPYPRTIAETQYGLVFLARDQELCLLRGDEVVPLGPTGLRKADENHSRIQRKLQTEMQNGELAWGMYNSQENAYKLRYTSNDTNANLFPQRGLVYSFHNRSFFPEKFDGHSVSYGFEMQDIEEAAAWDSIPFTWNEYNTSWDNAGLGIAPIREVIFSSSGTPYRFRSDQTSDDGTAIDWRWRSHGLNMENVFQQDLLYEVWMDYRSDTSSNVSLFVSSNLGATFDSGFSKTLSATSIMTEMFPVNITATSPLFEIRGNDGSVPRIARFQANLRDAGRFHGGL